MSSTLSGRINYGQSSLPSAAFEPVYMDKAGDEAIEELERLAKTTWLDHVLAGGPEITKIMLQGKASADAEWEDLLKWAEKKAKGK